MSWVPWTVRSRLCRARYGRLAAPPAGPPRGPLPPRRWRCRGAGRRPAVGSVAANISPGVIDSVGLAGAEFARIADSARFRCRPPVMADAPDRPVLFSLPFADHRLECVASGSLNDAGEASTLSR